MFLIAGCIAPAVVDPIEEPFDMIPLVVEMWAEADWITLEYPSSISASSADMVI